jgi:DNA-binding LytR/AlgR family response regulator
MKISTAEEQWKQYGFIRIHKGFLVNTHCVGDLFHNGIRMNDERIINIGRKHLLNVQENLLEAKSH